MDTEHLRLRHFREEDLPSLLAYRNDPAISRYQSWESMSEDFGRLFISEMKESQPGVPGYWFQFAIEEHATGQHVGDCALHTRGDDARLGEIGYTIAPEHHGRGFARESVTAMLDYAFTVLSMHRITAAVDVENIPSIRLLESLRFRREGHFIACGWYHNHWCDEYVYAMLHDEWIRLRAAPAGADAARVPGDTKGALR